MSARSSVLLMFVGAGALLSAGCKQCFPRRDVGRVQANVGPGVTEIQPRTGVQPFNGAVLSGPMTTPTQVAQGTRLEVAGAPAMVATPVAAVPQAVPAPTAVVAVPTPAPVMAQPVPMMPVAPVMPIPVAFATPGTRSSFVATGMAVPVAAVPMGPGVSVPMNSAAAVPTFGGPSFLSGEAVGSGLRLHPRPAGQPTTPAPTTPAPTTVPSRPSPPSDRPRTSTPSTTPRPSSPLDALIPERPAAPPTRPPTPPPTTTPEPSDLEPPARPKLDKPAPPPEEDGDLPPIPPDFKIPGLELEKE